MAAVRISDDLNVVGKISWRQTMQASIDNIIILIVILYHNSRDGNNNRSVIGVFSRCRIVLARTEVSE